MNLIEAVIFDMDGLLVDSEPIHFLTNQIFYSRYGKRFTTKHLREFMGIRVTEEVREFRKRWRLRPSVDELVKEREALFYRLVKTSLTLNHGARSLLMFLKENKIPMGLGTSAQPWYINFVMRRFRIRHFFSVVVGSDQVRRGKPHPER